MQKTQASNSLTKADIVFEKDSLMVSGNLDFVSVVNLWEKSLGFFNQIEKLQFDFSKVTSCNSAGLTLIIEWIKLAGLSTKTISFVNMPSQILSIASVCGVNNLMQKYMI